jgi:hypothetical protein
MGNSGGPKPPPLQSASLKSLLANVLAKSAEQPRTESSPTNITPPTPLPAPSTSSGQAAPAKPKEIPEAELKKMLEV